MSFTVFDKYGVAMYATEQFAPALDPGESILAGKYLDHYLLDGVPVPIPAQPAATDRFNRATKQWEPDYTMAETIALSRRLELLSASDWTQMPDVEINTKTQWAVYRQALRDITDQPGYPFNIIWPTSPQ